MPVYAAALFVSAALLFSVQPMAARHALPLLGGTPGVWTASMLFFQAVLLAGYAYAHAVGRLRVRPQIAIHAAVLLLPAAVFATFAPPAAPDDGTPPVLWLLGSLSVGVGLPFFALSTTASLLQRWFSRTDHPSAADPYFLYAASNLGSLAGLLAYPIVVEPLLPLERQRLFWAVGYAGFVALAAAAAVKAWRTTAVAPTAEPSTVTGRDRIRWILLAAAPSSLLLGVTQHVTTDLAPFPLLWVLPLAFYLLSFVVPFSRRPAIPHRLALLLQPILLVPLAFLIPWEPDSPGLVIPLAVPLHLAAFFTTALVCHGELAERRPEPSGLTDFYLCLAVGGALGGLFNAVLAPLLFRSAIEYPLMLVLAVLLRPKPEKGPDSPLGTALRLPAALLAIGGLTLLVRWLSAKGESSEPLRILLVVGAAVLLVPLLGGRRLRLATAVAALLLCGASGADRGFTVLHRDRSFFGAHRVERSEQGRRHLVHGHILHGAQEEDPKVRRLPITYYHREGPCGRMFQAFASRIPGGRVGVLGLGTGTIAAYGLSGQRWTFYEVDPAVERTARNWFTYLADCPAQVDVVLADGRRGLERAAPGEFGLIVLDAFSSDAVPVHLLTREAIGMYLDRLAEGGWLAIHISNRFVDLQRVVAGHVRERGLAARLANEPDLPAAIEATGRTRSTWVVVARRPDDLRPLDGDALWGPLPADATAPVWTDDWSAILPLILYR